MAFALVYIREVHPTDGWQVKENEREAVLVRQPRSLEERVEIGRTCMRKLALELPAVVDAMDDAVTRAWAGTPERLYLVGRDGRVVYKGGMGPMFFRPLEWEQAIEQLLAAPGPGSA